MPSGWGSVWLGSPQPLSWKIRHSPLRRSWRDQVGQSRNERTDERKWGTERVEVKSGVRENPRRVKSQTRA